MPRPAHTLEDFELELQSLRGAVLSMGGTALAMLETLGEMLQHNGTPDSALAKEKERELDVSEVRVDEQARIILIKYQPVASDLREVTGAVRIATDLERVGDEARRIITHYPQLVPWISSDAEGSLTVLWKMSRDLLQGAIHAFTSHDAAEARNLLQKKDQVGDEADRVLHRIGHQVASMRGLAPGFLDVVTAATSLQRIANSALNVAEAVIFIETAEDVRHRHLQGSSAQNQES